MIDEVGECDIFVSDKIEDFIDSSTSVSVTIGVPFIACDFAQFLDSCAGDRAEVVVFDVVAYVEGEVIQGAIIGVSSGSILVAVSFLVGRSVMDVTLDHAGVCRVEAL